MRRTSILFLCSTLAPSGACLIGCFGGGSGGGSGNDAGFPQQDGGFVFEGGFDALPDAIPTLDSGVEGGIPSFSTKPLDFGTADCGGQAPATQTYTFDNTGPATVIWTATVTAPFTLNGTSGGTASGNTATGQTGSVTVGVPAFPATSNAGPVNGTLTLSTNIPGFTSVTVPLTVMVEGGSLSLTPSVVGFGQVPDGTTSSALGFTITNLGNAAVSVTLGVPSDPEFTVTYTGAPTSSNIAPGATLAGASATFTPTAAGAAGATSAIQVTGALCNSTATVVNLSGTGTAGQVSIGPSPLDFGGVACGTAGAPQKVTIKNGNAFPITYQALLTASPSPYTVDAPSGSVAANSQAVITVTPAAIPATGNVAPGAYNDTLTITTNEPGGTPFAIPLDESASGAVLALTMATPNFGTVSNTTASQGFTITNTGSLSADVSLSLTETGADFVAALTQGSTAKASGGTAPGTVSYTARLNGTEKATLAAKTTAALCAPLPAALAISAIGAVPVVTPGNGTLNVTAECGTGSTTMATLTLQNTGNAPAQLAVNGSIHNAFNLVSAPNSIAPNSSANIVISGNIPIPGSTPASSAPIGDTLSFSTNEPTNPLHAFNVLDIVNGVNIQVSQPGPIEYCYTEYGFGILNSGTEDATLYTSICYGDEVGYGVFLYPDPFASGCNPSQPTALAAGQTVTGAVQQYDYAGSGSGFETLNIPVVGNLCVGPSPVALDITYMTQSNFQCFSGGEMTPLHGHPGLRKRLMRK